MSAKRLIFNADDYGLTEGISRGIREAHLKGVVTSTSVMVGSDYAAEAVRLALETAPTLGLGLHLTLSGHGRPVLPAQDIPSLVDANGQLYPFEAWLAHYTAYQADEIERELKAQVERFITLAGNAPDHLDGHHHAVYRHPVALRVLLDLARQYHLPIRNVWSDKPCEQAVQSLLAEADVAVRENAAPQLLALLEQPNLQSDLPAMPDRFVDSFYAQGAILGDLLLTLTGLADGVTEIMCHPGYADAALISDYTTERESEIQVLTQRSVREVIKAEEIELISYRDLQSVQPTA